MSSLAEATLYGDLVQYMRDGWAVYAAHIKGTSVDQERAALDERIRAWFFTPQAELHRLTPRDMIRNEQMGRPNVIPNDQLREALDDDYELYEMLRDDSPDGEPPEFHFGLAPERCLLDDYDPEGYDLRWPVDMESKPRRREAHQWLCDNANPHAFATNRFATTGMADDFVRRLYALGAENVYVENISSNVDRIVQEDGPYADTLVVELPDDPTERLALQEVFEYEMGFAPQLEVTTPNSAATLMFWWD